MLYIEVVKTVYPKCSQQKQKLFFSFLKILYLYKMMDVY